MVVLGNCVSMSEADRPENAILVDELDHYHEEWVPPFSFRDGVLIKTNEKFGDFYELYEEIGEGKFGKVYRCVEKATQLTLAAKCIRLKRDADIQKVEKEVHIMTQMKHKCIAQIYDAFATSSNDVILIMEIVEGGELFERVVDESYILTEMAVASIVYQLCEAIRYIHSQNIIHLDLKPENIMCKTLEGNQIKLIDFGLAQYFDGSGDLLFMAGTPEFAAPEVIKYEPLDFHTDMWSVGVITYILLSGQSPFLGENVAVTYCNVEKGKWEFCEEFEENSISEEAKDFISKLLILDKSKRLLPEECLQHPWIVRYKERARSEALLRQPNEGKPLAREKLQSYVRNKRFRKLVFGVLFLNSIIRQLNMLQERKSENGIRYVQNMLNAANADGSQNIMKTALFSKRRRDVLETEPIASTSREPSGEELHNKPKRSNQKAGEGQLQVESTQTTNVPVVLKVPLSMESSSQDSSRASSPKSLSPTRRKEKRKEEKTKRAKSASRKASSTEQAPKKPKTDSKKMLGKPPIPPPTDTQDDSQATVKLAVPRMKPKEQSSEDAKPFCLPVACAIPKPQTVGKEVSTNENMQSVAKPTTSAPAVVEKVVTEVSTIQTTIGSTQNLEKPRRVKSKETTVPKVDTEETKNIIPTQPSDTVEKAKNVKKASKKQLEAKADVPTASSSTTTESPLDFKPIALNRKLSASKPAEANQMAQPTTSLKVEERRRRNSACDTKPTSLVGSLLRKIEKNEAPPMLMHVSSYTPPTDPNKNETAKNEMVPTHEKELKENKNDKISVKVKKAIPSEVKNVSPTKEAADVASTKLLPLSLERKVISEKKTSIKKKAVKKETSVAGPNCVSNETSNCSTVQVKLHSVTTTEDTNNSTEKKAKSKDISSVAYSKSLTQVDKDTAAKSETKVMSIKEKLVGEAETLRMSKKQKTDGKSLVNGHLAVNESTIGKSTAVSISNGKLTSTGVVVEEEKRRVVDVGMHGKNLSAAVKTKRMEVVGDALKPPKPTHFESKSDEEKKEKTLRKRVSLKKQHGSLDNVLKEPISENGMSRKSVTFSNDSLDKTTSKTTTTLPPTDQNNRIFKSEADLHNTEISAAEVAKAKRKTRRSLQLDENLMNPSDAFDFKLLRAKLENRVLGVDAPVEVQPAKPTETRVQLTDTGNIHRVKSKWLEMDKALKKS